MRLLPFGRGFAGAASQLLLRHHGDGLDLEQRAIRARVMVTKRGRKNTTGVSFGTLNGVADVGSRLIFGKDRRVVAKLLLKGLHPSSLWPDDRTKMTCLIISIVLSVVIWVFNR